MPTATKSSPIFGPLRSAESAGTVALRGLVNDLGPQKASEVLMDQQQKIAIGERIRELRNNSPQTNRSIADHVGIGERAVAQWLAGGGISYENAEKVAELFDVDVQWLLSGRESVTGATPQLDRIEDLLKDVREAQERMEESQAYFQSVIEASRAQAQVPDVSQDHAQEPRRSPRARSAKGRRATGR